MVSIKRNMAELTDFLRETPPKLLQTALVLPAVDFGITGQIKPFFSRETIFRRGAAQQPPLAQL